VETAILVDMAFAFVAVVLAAYLGYFFDKDLGAFLLAALTAAASGLRLFAAMKWGWAGLLATMLLVGAAGAVLGYQLSKHRGARFVAFLWFWSCAISLIIYGHDDWVPLFTIALPSIILFWGGLFFLSGSILPPQEGIRDWRQKAFRSLVTFALGTNYPYYVIEDWKKEPLEPRVEGNINRKFLAGPGIVITSCDHSVTISNGLRFMGVRTPGLTFTSTYDRVYAVVDLRPQLRSFLVKAETKDGVPVTVFTFTPFRISVGEHQPRLGASYPFDEDAVFRAVHDQPIEHKWRRDDDGQAIEKQDKVPWDELVPIMAPPLLKDIIVEYTCDGLCAPGDPRTEIKQKFKERIAKEMEPCGIQILGGGISNIVPADEGVIKQRIESWKADWKRKIEIELGKGEAEVAQQLESARAQAQLDVVVNLAGVLTRTDEAMSEKVIALRLIEAIEEMTGESSVRQKLLEDGQGLDVILERLRRSI
jgi:regulator of protease activity HflC (stomatin/prohibitin superfamily)